MTQFASLPNFKFHQNVLHTYLFKFSSLQLSLRVIFILFTNLSCFLKIFENDDLSLHFIFYCFRLLDRNKVQFHGDYLHSTKLNQRVGMKRRISFAIPILILVAINICFNQVIRSQTQNSTSSKTAQPKFLKIVSNRFKPSVQSQCPRN